LLARVVHLDITLILQIFHVVKPVMVVLTLIMLIINVWIATLAA
jgi:hypothetical protein